VGKWYRRVNILQILGTQVWLVKWYHFLPYSKNGAEKEKGEWWRGKIQVLYIWYTVRTFVNATMYPQDNNKQQ
jgi:hypothetical protein